MTGEDAAVEESAPPTDDRPVSPADERSARPADHRLAELGVLTVVGLWALNFIVVKSAVDRFPPIAFALIRFSLASLTLLVVLRWREGSIQLPRRDVIPMVLLGVVGFGVYQVLWTVGLGSVAAGDSALLIASTPVLVAVLAVLAGSDVLTTVRLAGALISLLGVALVVGAETGFAFGQSLLGDVLTLGAAVCWASYTAWGAPILVRHSALRTTTWTIVFGTLFLAPVGLLQLASVGPEALTPPVWLAVLYSGTLSAGLPNVAIFYAVGLLGPTRVTAYQFLVPALTVVLAYIVLSEPIRAGEVLGGIVIVLGILVTRRARLGAGTVAGGRRWWEVLAPRR